MVNKRARYENNKETTIAKPKDCLEEGLDWSGHGCDLGRDPGPNHDSHSGSDLLLELLLFEFG
jgi:hypothetical protein